MNGFANEFLNMTLEGYDDGLLVKELVSGTKAHGIGSCIVVGKDSVGMFHRICLENVLYVPNLLHHHPRIFTRRDNVQSRTDILRTIFFWHFLVLYGSFLRSNIVAKRARNTLAAVWT
jgi:hypothetical protein